MKKRGVSVYVSWILVVSFVVILSVFMFNFMRNYAESSTENIKERALTSIECDSVAVTIDSACQNTQDLYINVTNRGDITVKGILFRTYDLYYEPQVDEKNLTLRIGKYNSQEINLVKRGDIKKIRKIEAVPIIISENTRIICEDKMTFYPLGDSMVPDCLDR